MKHIVLGALFLFVLVVGSAAPGVTAQAPTAMPTVEMTVPAQAPTTVPGAGMGTETPGMGMSTPMPVATIDQTANTPSYKLELILGPMEKMLTMDEAKTAQSGEVMVSGDMSMNMAGMAPNYHLEAHVTDITNGTVITDKPVAIQVTNDATSAVDKLPIAEMYDITIGQSDAHFGNNVALVPGNYTITINVAGESAIFHVNVPAP